MEWTFNNRPPSVFCLILKSQNLTETLQIEIRDIMVALPLKAYTLFRMPAKLLLQLILEARRLKFAGVSSEILITQKL